MVRGLYTAASGMNVQQNRLDEIANNLANVDLNGYKKDTAIQKAFPEMLMRRMNDDGVYTFPVGSVDTSPIVGTIGTGVETNEVYTNFSQAPLKQTENDFDMALEGRGFMMVQTPQGERLTRNGAFLVNSDGYLVTKTGDFVLGENGPIKLKKNNFVVDQDGTVWQNSTFAADDKRLVSQAENQWENIERVDRLQIVDVKRERYLQKQGNSYWKATDESGAPGIVGPDGRPKVRQGFLEGANVNAVQEMVEMIEVNRAYDANQKTIQTEDALIGKLWNEVVRV
ncbi:MAG: flagellar basal-body rod protein FlgF [Spirochaetia bacterium]